MSNASYIKLKEKIAKLEHDLNTLCNHPDSFEASLIKARRTMRHDFEKGMLSGSRIPPIQSSPKFLKAFDKACIEYPKMVNSK